MKGLSNFHRDERGATAVEFAIVASALILSILFVMTVGLYLYLNQALDYATSKAARQIMIGAAQTAAVPQGAFAATYVCPYLPAAIPCANVLVNIQSATEAAQPGGYYVFVNSNQSGLIVPTLSTTAMNYSLGAQGSYEYLQVLFPLTFLPGFATNILSHGVTYNGSPAILIVSTAAFRNEQY